MSEKVNAGCARPTGGPVGEAGADPESHENQNNEPIKENKPMIMVGKKAPDFTAPGYHNGEFVNVKLSESLGKWTLLCFYPGDFTFV